MSAVQGILFCLLLVYSSYSDIKTRESDDCLALMIALTAFIGKEVSDIPAMLLSAVLITIPMFLVLIVIVTDKETGTTSIPGSLKYLKVITTTTAGGVDKDSIIKNDDGTYELPSTVTVLVNTEQAKLLAKYEDNSIMQTALVYRGDKETADKFIAKQDDYLKNGGTVNE